MCEHDPPSLCARADRDIPNRARLDVCPQQRLAEAKVRRSLFDSQQSLTAVDVQAHSLRTLFSAKSRAQSAKQEPEMTKGKDRIR